MNRVEISGRLTRDVEVRKSTGGLSCGNFAIAVNDYVGVNRQTNKSEYRTSFINCSIFGLKCDSFVKYHRKGDFAVVYGKIQQRKYTNRQNQEVSTFEVLVEDYDLLPKAQKSDPAPQQLPPQVEEAPIDDLGNDDLPF